MHLKFLSRLAFLLIGVAGQITDIAQWPGFDDKASCVQHILGTACTTCARVMNVMHCQDWNCVCGLLTPAISTASVLAQSYCTYAGSLSDVSYVTSILSGFCLQLLPTSTTTPSPTATIHPWRQ